LIAPTRNRAYRSGSALGCGGKLLRWGLSLSDAGCASGLRRNRNRRASWSICLRGRLFERRRFRPDGRVRTRRNEILGERVVRLHHQTRQGHTEQRRHDGNARSDVRMRMWPAAVRVGEKGTIAALRAHRSHFALRQPHGERLSRSRLWRQSVDCAPFIDA
jgi:hypothetical protein